MNALEWAKAFYRQHVACTSGHDRGPAVDAIEEFAGIPAGSPWCAAFVWYCFHKAELDGGGFPSAPKEQGRGTGTQNAYPGSAGSQEMKARADELGLLFHDAQQLSSVKGALGGWTDSDGAHGHLFFVAGRLTDESGQVVAVRTVEGNSDSTPDNAVNELTRTVPTTDEGHDLWFIDVSGFIGGQWWG